MVWQCPHAFNDTGTAFMVPNFPNYGLMIFNVFPLVNTCHALGFSAFLMVDALNSLDVIYEPLK